MKTSELRPRVPKNSALQHHDLCDLNPSSLNRLTCTKSKFSLQVPRRRRMHRQPCPSISIPVFVSSIAVYRNYPLSEFLIIFSSFPWQSIKTNIVDSMNFSEASRCQKARQCIDWLGVRFVTAPLGSAADKLPEKPPPVAFLTSVNYSRDNNYHYFHHNCDRHRCGYTPLGSSCFRKHYALIAAANRLTNVPGRMISNRVPTSDSNLRSFQFDEERATVR